MRSSARTIASAWDTTGESARERCFAPLVRAWIHDDPGSTTLVRSNKGLKNDSVFASKAYDASFFFLDRESFGFVPEFYYIVGPTHQPQGEE